MTDTPGSDDLRAILRAGQAAVDPARQVSESLAHDPVLQVWGGELAATPPPRAGDRVSRPPDRPRLVLLSAGWAAVSMARGAVQVLGDLVDAGLVLAPHGSASRPSWLPPQVELRTGDVGLADEAGADAAREVARLLDSLDARDRLLALTSAHASTLLTLPSGQLSLSHVTDAVGYLAESGLAATEVARVLAVVTELGNGGFLRRAAPARILGLVLPPDPARPTDAAAVGDARLLDPRPEGGRAVEILLRRQGLWEGLPASVRAAASTSPAPEIPSVDLTVRRLAGGEGAVDAAARMARGRGYAVRILSRTLTGEAGGVGAGLARAALAVQDGVVPTALPACLLAGGVIRGGPPHRDRRELARAVSAGAGARLQGRQGVEVSGVELEGGALVAALVTR